LNAATRSKGNKIQIQEMGTIPNVWLASADYCAKHVGGAPRKDKEATAALEARVKELRNQRKKFREIKKQLDEETGIYRSEDTYHKLAKTGKNSAR
jgi:hypothetical protein